MEEIEFTDLIQKLLRKDDPIAFLYHCVENGSISLPTFESAFYWLASKKIVESLSG